MCMKESVSSPGCASGNVVAQMEAMSDASSAGCLRAFAMLQLSNQRHLPTGCSPSRIMEWRPMCDTSLNKLVRQLWVCNVHAKPVSDARPRPANKCTQPCHHVHLQ